MLSPLSSFDMQVLSLRMQYIGSVAPHHTTSHEHATSASPFSGPDDRATRRGARFVIAVCGTQATEAKIQHIAACAASLLGGFFVGTGGVFCGGTVVVAGAAIGGRKWVGITHLDICSG